MLSPSHSIGFCHQLLLDRCLVLDDDKAGGLEETLYKLITVKVFGSNITSWCCATASGQERYPPLDSYHFLEQGVLFRQPWCQLRMTWSF